MKILLTYFEAFAGRSVNQSSKVAKFLQRKLLARNSKFKVRTLELPVEYSTCVKKLKKHLEHFHYDLVLSFGEAPTPYLRLETRAQNLDNSPKRPDKAGKIRIRKKIIGGGPKFLPLTYQAQEMIHFVPANRKVHLSKSAGSFICNHLSYSMAYALRKKRGPLFGFIHVPHKDVKKAIGPQDSAKLLSKMLKTKFETKMFYISKGE